MAGNRILITGVSGYIGFKTLVLALEAGHQVRAVVHQADQSTKLQTHALIVPYVDLIQWAVIPDLTDIKSFDAHLTDITSILHLASPLAIETDDYDRDIVQPGIDITLSILNAASRTPSIKRVVITSSAVTLAPFARMFGPTSSSSDLTLFTPQRINLNPSKPYGSSMEAYFASKTLCRIATHDFIASHHPSFEVVNLLPTVVIGPDARASSGAELMESTRALVLGLLMESTGPELVGATVHVDDVAQAHIDALKPSVPGNTDYILSSDAPEGIVWEDAKDIVRKEFPNAVESGILRLSGSMGTRKFRVNTSETVKAFGWRCASFYKTIKDLVGQYLGFIKAGQN